MAPKRKGAKGRGQAGRKKAAADPLTLTNEQQTAIHELENLNRQVVEHNISLILKACDRHDEMLEDEVTTFCMRLPAKVLDMPFDEFLKSYCGTEGSVAAGPGASGRAGAAKPPRPAGGLPPRSGAMTARAGATLVEPKTALRTTRRGGNKGVPQIAETPAVTAFKQVGIARTEAPKLCYAMMDGSELQMTMEDIAQLHPDAAAYFQKFNEIMMTVRRP